MEYFSNMSFNTCGKDKKLDVWLKNYISPVKKKKRTAQKSKRGETRRAYGRKGLVRLILSIKSLLIIILCYIIERFRSVPCAKQDNV